MNSTPSQSTTTSEPAIALSEASRHHRMGDALVRAVDNVSFTVERGSFVALLGSSGSGKSTLLNLIAGLDRPTSGRVEVMGRDLAKMSREQLALHRRSTVGMVFQAFQLVPSMTLAENVELPMLFAEVDAAEREGRVRDALDRVGLADRADHHPGQLSGGEQQRAALARALANRPSILLADEPTGNLDSHNGAEVLEMIARFNREMGMTVVLVTHEQALADRYTSRKILISDGKLAGR